MVPELSEFSYGFALTHEIANLAGSDLQFVPIFPSLIEEGKSGGGYDVKLEWSGVPIFLQFKRADCLVRSSAKQILDGLSLAIPFYRFPIMERQKSSQHDLLLAIDFAPNEVFYVAPRFHLVVELNDAYQTKTIADRSLFIRPRDIGKLDDKKHCVAFDNTQHFICSEPRAIHAMDGVSFRKNLFERLTTEEKPLGEIVDSAYSSLSEALKGFGPLPFDHDFGRLDKTPEERKLQSIADLALRYFNAQFFIVQRIEISVEGGT